MGIRAGKGKKFCFRYTANSKGLTMKDIIRALNSDEDFRRAFKDKIAMAFKDGYSRCEKKYKNR